MLFVLGALVVPHDSWGLLGLLDLASGSCRVGSGGESPSFIRAVQIELGYVCLLRVAYLLPL